MFANDENIVKASIQMVAAMLKANRRRDRLLHPKLWKVAPLTHRLPRLQARQTTDLLASSTVVKAVAAVFSGELYQKSLSQSLEEIKSSGQILLNEAHKSHMWQNRTAMEKTEEGSYDAPDCLLYIDL